MDRKEDLTMYKNAQKLGGVADSAPNMIAAHIGNDYEMMQPETGGHNNYQINNYNNNYKTGN